MIRFVMPKCCGECAFVVGSAGHNSEMTRLTAELCVMSREPFYCHHLDEPGAISPRPDGIGGDVLCRGFVDALATSKPAPAWKCAVATECLRMLEDDERAIRARHEQILLAHVRQTLHAGEA